MHKHFSPTILRFHMLVLYFLRIKFPQGYAKKQRYKNIETTTFIEDHDLIKVESLIRSFNVPKRHPSITFLTCIEVSGRT